MHEKTAGCIQAEKLLDALHIEQPKEKSPPVAGGVGYRASLPST